jgi:P-type Ca2+ transporter type 2C
MTQPQPTNKKAAGGLRVEGLSAAAVIQSSAEFGLNTLMLNTKPRWLESLKDVVLEPMFLLLVVACTIYFVLGKTQEAITLIIALFLVAGISLYQTARSNQALSALHDLTQPQAQVWRSGVLTSLAVEKIVVGDWVATAEGQRVPADGLIKSSQDFSLDESVLTGESVAVMKAEKDQVFAGTSIITGSALLEINAVGQKTKMGQIGKSMAVIQTEKTPLQLQINHFVFSMAWVGAAAFILVGAVNYSRSGDWISALLLSLTLVMALLPEEIPVAFSSFMALGAARLSKIGVLTKQPQTVESLGSATVICSDKTGTITEDGMTLRQIYDGTSKTIVSLDQSLSVSSQKVLAFARWASEDQPFDAMEHAIVSAFEKSNQTTVYPMLHEYPLGGTPPMMTHVRQAPNGEVFIAGKGAVDHVLAVCKPEAKEQILAVTKELSSQGLRVLGVAKGAWTGTPYPSQQDDFTWTFLGLIAFENPPKANAASTIKAFNQAGIKVKLITGDYLETAQAIARQIGLTGSENFMTGEQVMSLDTDSLQEKVTDTAIFARMFPEAKLKVVEALKANGEIVAMTGDGVNDGPALKAAHIGVAMGQRGSEVARQAASLILVNDDLGKMVDAIAQGRRIYQNLKKAILYIVGIHIPIILIVAIPLLANWKFANLFTPIHIIFLELVMGPTCSIAFENEPAEVGQMRQSPRKPSDSFLSASELRRSLAQGLGITFANLSIYYMAMQNGSSLEVVRTLVFCTLVLSNIFLTLVNRSLSQYVFQTLGVPNKVLWLMLGITLLLLTTTLFFVPAQQLFGFTVVPLTDLAWSALAALLGVVWIEIYKAIGSFRATTSVKQRM